MECKITYTKRRRCAGVTLIEMLFASAIGVIVVGTLVMVQLFANGSFASLYNYVTLDKQSLMALDTISRQVRQASAMTSFATNDVSFTNSVGGYGCRYVFDPSATTLTGITNGVTNILLTNCNSLTFSIFTQAPQQTNFSGYVATNAAQAKMLQIQWNCSKYLHRGQTNQTEEMQSARIVMRN